jgi:hypothetical protein
MEGMCNSFGSKFAGGYYMRPAQTMELIYRDADTAAVMEPLSTLPLNAFNYCCCTGTGGRTISGSAWWM